MKFIQKSLEQTGVAKFELVNGKEKIIPLFSLTPSEEAYEILRYSNDLVKLKAVYCSNNLMEGYRIEDAIKDFINEYGYLSEDLMDELASGFPFILGEEPGFSKKYYK